MRPQNFLSVFLVCTMWVACTSKDGTPSPSQGSAPSPSQANPPSASQSNPPSPSVAYAVCTGASPFWTATADEASVQACINNALSGDTITVAAGTFTVNTGIVWSNKKLTLVGAGIDVTTIIDNGSNGYALAVTGASDTNFADISGFTFTNNGTSDHGDGMVEIEGVQFSQGFRFHHNKVTHSNVGRGLYVYYIYGLVDHNTFEVTEATGLQSVSVAGGSFGADGGFIPWQQPLSLGTNNAVFLEQNTFTNTAASAFTEDTIDMYSGARIVIRYNAFVCAHHGFHGTDTGSTRSPVSFEIYNNSYTNNCGANLSGMQIRGGTGVIYDNTYHGPYNYGMYGLVYHRTDGSGDVSTWQNCNGTNWQLGSIVLVDNASRQCSLNGGVQFCSGNRELLCAADDSCAAAGAGSCTTYFDTTSADGYLCRDQPGVGPGQVSAPIYAWNNSGFQPPTLNSGNAYILENRDFFNNTAKPGYAPYTYPHPSQTR